MKNLFADQTLLKVSIVVPIYKVEKYIHRCIDSILGQTHSNIEVILVNDGSPDNCGMIVEQYKAIDERIKVIHKENGGLSDARNYGMKEVTGEFTMFVDSDDWLEKNMVEVMVNCIIKYKADVVQSAFYYAYENKLLIDRRRYKINDTSIIFNNKELMYELVINERVENFAWGKLYKTEIIKNVPFKVGVLFEDIFWAYKVMHKVNNFILLPQPLYNYYQRNDSIVANYTPRNLDILKGLKERHQFLEEHYTSLLKESYKILLNTNLVHYNLLLANRKKDKDGINRKEIEKYINANYNNFKKAVEENRALENQLNLFILHPYLNVFFLGLYKCVRLLKLKDEPVGLEVIER
jgi:glycosyltransferase involved in cell wall biosynthesis